MRSSGLIEMENGKLRVENKEFAEAHSCMPSPLSTFHY
jgi:hypothetical protein